MFGAMKLLDRVGDVGLRRRLAASTIACYQSWISEFLRFNRVQGRWRMPAELSAADVERFLTHLARDRRVSASTQNPATSVVAAGNMGTTSTPTTSATNASPAGVLH